MINAEAAADRDAYDEAPPESKPFADLCVTVGGGQGMREDHRDP